MLQRSLREMYGISDTRRTDNSRVVPRRRRHVPSLVGVADNDTPAADEIIRTEAIIYRYGLVNGIWPMHPFINANRIPRPLLNDRQYPCGGRTRKSHISGDGGVQCIVRIRRRRAGKVPVYVQCETDHNRRQQARTYLIFISKRSFFRLFINWFFFRLVLPRVHLCKIYPTGNIRLNYFPLISFGFSTFPTLLPLCYSYFARGLSQYFGYFFHAIQICIQN